MTGSNHSRSSSGTHSPDGRWWHDRHGWRPAVTHSGDRWFDGVTWEPNRRPSAALVLAAGIAALVAVPVIAALVFVEIFSDPSYPGQPNAGWVIALYDHPLWWVPVGPALFLLSVAYFVWRPVRPLRPTDTPPG